MKIFFVYRILPCLVFYTDNIPKGFGAVTNGIVVRIKHKYKNDIGILMHEMEHCKQAYRLLIVLHALLYLFSHRYRLWAEVCAYKQQLKYPPASDNYDEYAQKFAKAIANKYGLDISEQYARSLLD